MTTTPAALLLLLLSPAPAPPQPAPPQQPAALAFPTPDPDLLLPQARARLAQGDSAGAEQLLQQALAASPNSPSANLALGQLLLAGHRYPEAMDRFETVLALNLRDSGARSGELSAATLLALSTRNAGNPQAAFLCLEHAREHLPDDPTLLLDLGIQAEQVRQLPVAQEALEAALQIRPQDPPTLYALSRVELDREHFADSERHLRAYLALHPDDPTAHFGLGHLLAMQQHTADAKSEFQRSIDLQPLQTESYFQLGQIALDASSPDAASPAAAGPLFEKTLARDPRHGGALTGLGILAYRAKDYTRARTRLILAVQAAPEYQPAHYYLGLTLARLGEKAESDRELKLAIDLAHSQDPRTAHAASPVAPAVSPPQ